MFAGTPEGECDGVGVTNRIVAKDAVENRSTPTATVARQAEIPLSVGKTNQDSYDELKRLNADLFVVVAWQKYPNVTLIYHG